MISLHLHHTQLLCILLAFTETKPKKKRKRSINQFAMFLNPVYSIKYSCAHNEMFHGP
ncbi:hypothetical protein ACB094_04G058800 [Castanea mollissima]